MRERNVGKYNCSESFSYLTENKCEGDFTTTHVNGEEWYIFSKTFEKHIAQNRHGFRAISFLLIWTLLSYMSYLETTHITLLVNLCLQNKNKTKINISFSKITFIKEFWIWKKEFFSKFLGLGARSVLWFGSSRQKWFNHVWIIEQTINHATNEWTIRTMTSFNVYVFEKYESARTTPM